MADEMQLLHLFQKHRVWRGMREGRDMLPAFSFV